MRIGATNWVQLGMIAALVLGSHMQNIWLTGSAAGLMITGLALQLGRLLPLARVFLCIAALAAVASAIVMPQSLEQLGRAAIQGTGYAALLTTLGMMRHPVRQSPAVRAAAEYLTSAPPRYRFASVNVGAHFLSLLFNVGVIPMMAELLRRDDETAIVTPERRALVLGAMRGSDLVTIWSPLGLGFAIVTTGIPALEPLAFLFLAGGFTAIALLVTCRWPMLGAMLRSRPGPKATPEMPAARIAPQTSDRSAAPTGSLSTAHPMRNVLAICAALLLGAILLHEYADVTFTVASVTILPVFTLIWLVLERGNGQRILWDDIGSTLSGLSDMRSESAIFLAASVIGTAFALALQQGPAGDTAAALPALPVLLALLLLIPAAAAVYLPNSIVVVIAVQLLGGSALGTEHPMALALVLSASWASAVAVSPVSAMCLMVGRACGVPARHVAWRWNLAYSLTVTGLAALGVSALVLTGTG